MHVDRWKLNEDSSGSSGPLITLNLFLNLEYHGPYTCDDRIIYSSGARRVVCPSLQIVILTARALAEPYTLGDYWFGAGLSSNADTMIFI